MWIMSYSLAVRRRCVQNQSFRLTAGLGLPKHICILVHLRRLLLGLALVHVMNLARNTMLTLRRVLVSWWAPSQIHYHRHMVWLR